jgi:hypothetical protein
MKSHSQDSNSAPPIYEADPIQLGISYWVSDKKTFILLTLSSFHMQYLNFKR